ncbi:energy transducer TonB [Snuella sedimenti]|uniref:Energy transducer TonB n=1 Tax=Snuella sedimenti TaxID=2798802 RepID=A0A8J7IGX4_9FLAO|nr:energy transducer TonB [Snuella sedimenti]MBJ6368013.1 energy transducer TonB [Snuella sedimenti]
MSKSQKHDANLQKNSTLYFQVGLIVCLLFSYGLLEMKFETLVPKDLGEILTPDDTFETEVPQFKIYEAPKAEEKRPEKKVVLTLPPEIIDNSEEKKETLKIITAEQNITTEPVLDPGDISVSNIPDETDVDFVRVEQVPIYPGCETEKNNEGRRKCMSDKITKLVKRKFDTDLASDLGLTGIQVIYTQFKIDKNGHVTDIKTRAPHTKLEHEAKRVIDKIPVMTPGKQRDRAVGVIYTLPIKFRVQN